MGTSRSVYTSTVILVLVLCSDILITVDGARKRARTPGKPGVPEPDAPVAHEDYSNKPCKPFKQQMDVATLPGDKALAYATSCYKLLTGDHRIGQGTVRFPTHAWASLGLLFHQHRDWSRALRCLASAAQEGSSNPRVYQGLGDGALSVGGPGSKHKAAQAYYAAGVNYAKEEQYQQAETYYQKALDLGGSNPQYLFELAVVKQALGNHRHAIKLYNRALEDAMTEENGHKVSKRPEVNSLLAVSLSEVNEFESALEHAEIAIRSAPSVGVHYDHYGAVLSKAGRMQEACAKFEQAVKLSPAETPFLRHYASCLTRQGRYQDACDYLAIAYRQTRGEDMQAVMAYVHALLRINDNDKVIRILTRFLGNHPGHPHASIELTRAYLQRNDDSDAELANDAVRYALLQRSSSSSTLSDRERMLLLGEGISTALATSSWQELRGYQRALAAVLTRMSAADQGGERDDGNVDALHQLLPFEVLKFALPTAARVDAARRYARSVYRGGVEASYHRGQAQWNHGDDRKQPKLRLGYVCSDFGNHATAYLLRSMFAMHRDSLMDVYAYDVNATNAHSRSEYKESIAAAVTHYRQVGADDDDTVVQRIKEDKIDILIDLNGHTSGARGGIFARRAAPVQILHGAAFPATSGAPSTVIDYYLADRITVPPGLPDPRPFTEAVAYTRHFYTCNDHRQALPSLAREAIQDRQSFLRTHRPTHHLPIDAVVLACFNQLYKVTPGVFKVWLKVLKEVPNSVLWLLDRPSAARSSLVQQAQAADVDASRVVFMPPLPPKEHAARIPLADLALDTYTVNGHTTSADTLYAGVPLLTRPCGAYHFAGRVTTSMLTELGMQADLVVSTLKEYEERALYLATHPSELAALRSRLVAQVLDPKASQLFSTQAWVQDYEYLLQGVYDVVRIASDTCREDGERCEGRMFDYVA